MAKKSFLVPLAVTLSAIIGSANVHASGPSSYSLDDKPVTTAADSDVLGDLVLDRASSAHDTAESFAAHSSHSSHVSHSSHSSHASHESHSSHYSSY